MIINFRGELINSKYIYRIYYQYECLYGFPPRYILTVLLCNVPAEFDWNTESPHILRFNFPSEREVLKCINEKFIPAMKNTNNLLRKKIRKLEKRQDELEAALKFITGNEEYRKAYQEFKALQFSDAQ